MKLAKAQRRVVDAAALCQNFDNDDNPPEVRRLYRHRSNLLLNAILWPLAAQWLLDRPEQRLWIEQFWVPGGRSRRLVKALEVLAGRR
jgi:hypothetical protein